LDVAGIEPATPCLQSRAIASNNSLPFSLTTYVSNKSGNLLSLKSQPQLAENNPFVHSSCTNVPRDPGGLYGPGTKTFDLSLSRRFPLPFHENSLMFRAEFFNAFNTPQFGRPGATVGTTSFGKITSTSGSEPNRIIQLALKYNF
jgi:hypothetical protein